MNITVAIGLIAIGMIVVGIARSRHKPRYVAHWTYHISLTPVRIYDWEREGDHFDWMGFVDEEGRPLPKLPSTFTDYLKSIGVL
jgi:hypothetical protein